MAKKELKDIIVKQLEDNTVSLDNSVELFQEGIQLSKFCSDKLSSVEEKVSKIMIDGELKDFKIEGKIINATIEKESTGKFYVSVVVETKDIEVTKLEPTSIVGIDLGIKDLVVLSDGTKYTNPKELNKREKQLKRLQRKLARQIKGSQNYNKTKIRIARIHSKIKNSRKHNIIKIVNEIVKEYDCIISENLNVKGLIQNHKLAKSIVDASFNKI